MSFSDPFYTPEYFKYQLEILDFESEDPREHVRGEQALAQKAEAGETDAMLVLGRHYLRGRYRDAYAGLQWYLKAMRRGDAEGWGMLQRFYAHPDDTDMEEALRRMEAEGHTMDNLKKMWQSLRSSDG